VRRRGGGTPIWCGSAESCSGHRSPTTSQTRGRKRVHGEQREGQHSRLLHACIFSRIRRPKSVCWQVCHSQNKTNTTKATVSKSVKEKIVAPQRCISTPQRLRQGIVWRVSKMSRSKMSRRTSGGALSFREQSCRILWSLSACFDINFFFYFPR